MLTQLPGFPDPGHDAQRTFRALLTALSRPGMPPAIPTITTPQGLLPSCAAAALILFDLETTIWLQPGVADEVRVWWLFYMGCQFTDALAAADFAVISAVDALPELAEFNWGTPEYLEASTSLLVQLPSLSGGRVISMHGLGIAHAVEIDLPIDAEFWPQWQALHEQYPLGPDCWWFVGDRVLGLPRTTRPDLSIPIH